MDRVNPATNEEDALKRVGVDVIQLTLEDQIQYAKDLGILRKMTKEDIKKMARGISPLFFEPVFDSLDEFSNELNIKLTPGGVAIC